MPRVLKSESRKNSWSLPCHVIRLRAPILILHGGVGAWAQNRKQAAKAMHAIAARLRPLLLSEDLNASTLALEAVLELESDPTFNAGVGSKIQADGIPRLSASIMDGNSQRMASVANILRVKHPSLIAHELLQSKDSRNLAGIDASRFAFSQGFTPELVETEATWLGYCHQTKGLSGTVGAVALDTTFKTAACTSTGGRGYELPGRLSDSCGPAGNFAAHEGAVSCTGFGEEIIDASVASSIVTRLQDEMTLETALNKVFHKHMEKHFGLIALDRTGHSCVHATDGFLPFAILSRQQSFTGTSESDWRRLS